MTMAKLVAAVPPPNNPVANRDQEAWEHIQNELKIKFPNDYFDFVTIYGSGGFNDKGRLKITIYNPMSYGYLDEIRAHESILSSFKNEKGAGRIKFKLHPHVPGLLALGSDDNGNEIYWLTNKKANAWRIVIRSPENEYEEYGLPLTDFLAKFFCREMAVGVWPPPFFEESHNIEFQPAANLAAAVEPKNIYELYVENNNRANFWAISHGAQKGVRIHIRSIDGKESGQLPGIPSEYGRPPITGDLYVGNNIYESSTNLTSGYQRAYYLAD